MGIRVLIAVDASSHAQDAFDFYFKNLHQPDNFIILVHCAEQPNLSAISFKEPLTLPTNEWADEMKKHIEAAKNVEELFVGKLIEHKARYEAHVIPGGEVGAAICKCCEENKADIIVMGSRGLNALRRTFLGSVSDYVIHHTNVAVTIVPKE